MYDERYDNHFRRLRASRDTFAAFADFTLEALKPASVAKLLRDERPALQAALDQFRLGLRGRTTGSGQRQRGTQTENEAFEDLKKLVQINNIRLLQPRFLEHPAEEVLFYPDKLIGLTGAAKTKRLTRFAAYVQQLEEHSDAALQTAGAQTKALLAVYTEATTVKNRGQKAVQDTISDLGPDALALADALWDVHCTALYVHRREPAKASTYFNYALLPKRNTQRTAGRKKTPPPTNPAE
ncbi:hypothetical protein [Hymenobacter chitinivorans]|uniref:Uncharacterized protein n=1 Tax=Hymenobacter chitinivorans DSM 11115 TaxID=1121954 RepID=A0A2M9BLJ3_9BACT|nr:hypothetical protein [Hymenobacter chitinivorans]PJJ58826.1 hypothetical protein CLV45_0237 [Hymenobacter chitinivorans DSM 11115]